MARFSTRTRRRACDLTIIACLAAGVLLCTWPQKAPAARTEMTTVFVPVPVAPASPHQTTPSVPVVPVVPVKPSPAPQAV